MAAIAVMIGSIIEPQSSFINETYSILLLSFSAFLITSGGNILNDLGDIEIDQKGHPQRPLAKGAIMEKNARFLLGSLWSLGFISACLASLMVKASLPILIVMASTALIIIYENKLKHRGFMGNIAIGALTGAPFLLGASVGIISYPVTAIFLMASLSNISREIMKDIEDMRVDKGYRRTLPLRYGIKKASLNATFIMLFAIMASAIPLLTKKIDPVYASGIGAADIIFLISIRTLYSDPRKAQSIAKLGMLFAMAVFLLWSLGL
jgi:geranylgeranylglycerol-phosphate geranylgeranyltransferase